MTRKDYKAISDALFALGAAEVTRDANSEDTSYEAERHAGAMTMLDKVASRLANVCAAENPRFDRTKFLAACKVKG